MKRAPSPASGLPPTSKARCDDSDDDENGPTDLDINFLKEQNLQLATCLYGYRQKLQQYTSELTQLRRKSTHDATITSTLFRQLQVLHSDLLDMAKSVHSNEISEEEKDIYEKIKSELMLKSDRYLLSTSKPVVIEKEILLAEWSKIKDHQNETIQQNEEDEEDEENEVILKECGLSQSEKENSTKEWLNEELESVCSKSHELIATLIPSLTTTLQHMTQEETNRIHDENEKSENEGFTSLLISNRSLHAEIVTLKDTILRLSRQAKVDKVVTLQAQRSSHQSERLLHLHLASKTIDPNITQTSSISLQPHGSTNEATSLSTINENGHANQPPQTPSQTPSSHGESTSSANAIPSTPQSSSISLSENHQESSSSSSNAMDCDPSSSFDGTIGNSVETSLVVNEREVNEEYGSIVSVAELRLTQLERLRDELKKSQDEHSALLEKVALMNASDRQRLNQTHETPERNVKFLENELERERRQGRIIKESAQRISDELKAVNERMKATESRYESWCQTSEKKYTDTISSLNAEMVKMAEEMDRQKARCAMTVELERDNETLRNQVSEFNSLLEISNTKIETFKKYAESSRKAEEQRSVEAENARKLNLEFVDKFQLEEGEEEDTLYESEELGKECSIKVYTLKITSLNNELSSQKEINEAMLEELEHNAKVVDDLAMKNTKLLQQTIDQEEINRILMTKNRLLRDAKDSEEAEREALVIRLASSEETRQQLEELSRTKETFVRAAEMQRSQHSSQLLIKEREFIHTTEKNNKLESELEELKINFNHKKTLQSCEESRVQVLSEEMKGLRRERDKLEESLDDAKRRYDKLQRKFEKEKKKVNDDGDNGGSGGGRKVDDSEIEYRELLEFENEELKKQVNCPIIKEKMKNVMLMKCGHTFSRDAIDKRVSDRMRRCPACNKAFGVDDVKAIYLTS
mmetsp:Transcript_53654/g.68900  ORF Transcript_53654/g.68900 Transcript_53654/m.68900 type:complete len:930 (+) Transcript_53654:36-2825(+)